MFGSYGSITRPAKMVQRHSVIVHRLKVKINADHLLNQLFIVLLLLCCLTQAEDCELEIWKNGIQIENSDLCEQQYKTQDCSAFAQSFDKSHLPYEMNGYSVEKPASIDLIGLRAPWDYQGITWMYPLVSVIWDAPISDASKAACQGYLIVWSFEGGPIQCRLYKFNPDSKIRAEKLSFRSDLKYVKDNVTLEFKVYSMPPPDIASSQDPRTFVTKNIFTPATYNQAKGPGYWIPSISYETFKNGTIIVEYSLSPPEYNLTRFEITLVDQTDLDGSVRQDIVDEQVYSEKKPKGSHSFSAIPSGTYQIVIWMRDLYRGQGEDKCQCWTIESGGNKHCKNICGGVHTRWFHLNVTEPSSAHPVTTEPSHKPSSLETGESSEGTDSVIIGVVVGIVILAVVFSGIIFYLGKTRKVKACIMTMWSPQESTENPRNSVLRPWTNFEYSTHFPSFATLVVPNLTEKTLYVISADDHPALTDSVKCLVKFFQVHCRCNMIYPPWNYKHTMGTYEWFLANITKSSLIMFIDSVGAEKLIMAHLHKKEYRSRKCDTNADLFNTGLKHIMSDQEAEARENAVVVSFGGKRCQQYLQAARTFELPDQLPELLCKIHNLDMNLSKSFSNYLPMCVENIPQLEEGSKLLSAIDSHKTYEANNPNWFEQIFGTPVPILQHNFSIMSDEGFHSLPHSSTRSVSTQDLSEMESTSGSPLSVTSQPDFTASSHPHNFTVLSPYLTSMNSGPYQHRPPFTAVQTHPQHLHMKRVDENIGLGKDASTDDVKSFSIFTLGTNILSRSETGHEEGGTCPSQPSLAHIHDHPNQNSIGADKSQKLCDESNLADGDSYSNRNLENRENALWMPKDDMSLIPPESASQIVFDSFSAACRDINNQTDEIPKSGLKHEVLLGTDQGPSNQNTNMPSSQNGPQPCRHHPESGIARNIPTGELCLLPLRLEPVTDSERQFSYSSRLATIPDLDCQPEHHTSERVDNFVMKPPHQPQTVSSFGSQLDHPNMPQNSGEFFDQILPPDSLSDIQVDSLSAAFWEINARSNKDFVGDRGYGQGHWRDEDDDDDDDGGYDDEEGIDGNDDDHKVDSISV